MQGRLRGGTANARTAPQPITTTARDFARAVAQEFSTQAGHLLADRLPARLADPREALDKQEATGANSTPNAKQVQAVNTNDQLGRLNAIAFDLRERFISLELAVVSGRPGDGVEVQRGQGTTTIEAQGVNDRIESTLCHLYDISDCLSRLCNYLGVAV